jgi:hypothetical protein
MRLVFDEISPITGRKTVLVEADETMQDHVKLCMETGYQTCVRKWVEGSETLAEHETKVPDIVLRRRFVEEGTNNVWFLSVLFCQNVVLTPVDHGDGYQWAVIPLKPVTEDTDLSSVTVLTLMVDDQPVMKYLDTTAALPFAPDQFETALNSYYTQATQPV